MIIGLAKRIVFGILKKIISLIVIVVAFIWVVFHQETVKVWYHNVAAVFSSKYQVDVVTKDGNFNFTLDAKKAIDQWLFANKLNEYGDPQGTVYAGGTPLFNEVTGKTADRYEYIVEQHPELKSLIK